MSAIKIQCPGCGMLQNFEQIFGHKRCVDCRHCVSPEAYNRLVELESIIDQHDEKCRLAECELLRKDLG